MPRKAKRIVGTYPPHDKDGKPFPCPVIKYNNGLPVIVAYIPAKKTRKGWQFASGDEVNVADWKK
jgi:hypothetical protein